MSFHVVAVALGALCYSAASGPSLADSESQQVEALAGDDECAADDASGCALSALQLRGAASHGGREAAEFTSDGSLAQAPPASSMPTGVEYKSLPDGWIAAIDFPGIWSSAPMDWSQLPVPAGTSREASSGVGAGLIAEGSVAEGVDCSVTWWLRNCALLMMCRGPRYCVLGGYMVVPGFAVAGMENINGGNAASFDYLMSAARSSCGSAGYVLITNPVGYRTQDQLHIHYRHLTEGGTSLKRRLEQAVCGKQGWHYFKKCGDGKVRLYPHFPGVFSQVAAAYGGKSLANVGITVWFTTACGNGLQTIILATTHCSIEHEISKR